MQIQATSVQNTAQQANGAFGNHPSGAQQVAQTAANEESADFIRSPFKKPTSAAPTQDTLSISSNPMPVVSQARLMLQTYGPTGYPIYGYQLPNGHRLIIEKRPTELVSLRTFVNAGSILENPVKPSPMYPETGVLSGLAHLDEHCHFLATRRFPQLNQWVKQTEMYGCKVNASTTPEVIQHEMSFNIEDTYRMLEMHADNVLQPLYKYEHIGQEKVNVINEMSERALLPANRVGNALWDMMFDRPAFQTLGKPQDVKTASPYHLREFFSLAYTPSNLVTVVSGNINPNNVLPQFENLFGKNPARASLLPNAAVRPALAQGQIRSQTVYDAELNYSIVNIGFNAPHRKNIKDRVAMECLDVLLSNRTPGSLNELLRERTAVASDMNTHFSPMKMTGLYEIQIHTRPGQEKESLSLTLGRLNQMATYGISNEDLNRTKSILKSAFQKAHENTALVSYVLGEEATQGDMNYLLKYPQILDSITPSDIQRMLMYYVNPKTYAVAFGIPGTSVKEAGNPFATEKKLVTLNKTASPAANPTPVVPTTPQQSKLGDAS